MTLFGKIVVIKRNGTDGISFPLTASSCLFGRRTECDIRIQLPQVSKEHCKIEVNENKEAILINLSTVNPTQLNGAGFQQPVTLKHGDVVTIIDRSFRFEYPLQATPRKRRSRSPKDETLQQVAEVELQTSGSKSLHASGNAECKGKDANENKQSTEENISKALPVKLQTPKSSHKIDESAKKENSVSPFSKLYEKLKNEIKVKKPLPHGNATQEAAKGDGKNVPLEPSTQISVLGCDLGNLSKEQERGRSENIEECKVEIKQDVVTSEFNQVSAVRSATKKRFIKSPRTSISKVSRDTGERSHLQDHKEPSTAGKSGSTRVTAKPTQEKDGSAVFSLKQCSIECLDYAGEMKMQSSGAASDKTAQPGNTTNVSEVDQHVLSTPTSRRKSPRSIFVSPTRESIGMNSVITDTPTPRRRVSLKRRSLSGVAAETQREDSLSISDSLKQLPLAENKCLKQRQSSKQHTPGKPAEVLKEICDQANIVNSNEEHLEPPACSNSRSPRRNNRESQELPNKSVHLDILASEELRSELASPASHKGGSGRKRGGPRSSGLLTGKPLETSAPLEQHNKPTDRRDSGMKEEQTTKEDHQEQGLEDAGVTRPRRLSSKRRSSGGTALLKDTEAVSEMSISDLLAGEESGKTTKMSPKRKSGEVLLQPLGKRKRVSFGGHLSPELFDKSLPPNSPLKRGAIPARLSLPFGNSPRAVLKKAQGLKHSAVQELPEHLQKEKLSPKNLPAQKFPCALSPSSGRATPKLPPGSPAPYKKGRFSVSHVMAPLPIVEERDAVREDTNTEEKDGALVKTPKSSLVNQNDKPFLTATPDKLTRSAQLALKVASMKSRSGAVAVFNAKRRSGASNANLLVAKSWAEVVKSGVARPQAKAVKKSVRKRKLLKKTTQSPKTPESKIRGHFSTGHAESPATIVVGRAYSTTVRTSGRVPKVMKNPILKLNMNMDESFTGVAEMFQTPENLSGKTLPLAAVQKMDFTPTCTSGDLSELHTPEETGEMMVSPLNSSDASEHKQDSPGICHLLREESPLKSVFDAIATKTPEKRNAMLEENTGGNSLSVTPEKQTSRGKSGSRRRTPKQKLEPAEVVSGVKQLLRTPEQRSEPVEALLGIKQLMKTPKQKLEPVEALTGIKQLMRTPKHKLEPVEALSGIKQLLKTPKQKSEPVEALSGIRQLMKTPKQKSEPVEALSGIRQLMKTPKQKSEPVEALSGIRQLMKTPKQESELVEPLSDIKQHLRTPEQKSEPAEVLSGIKQLMRTPKRKLQAVEALSGIRQLMKTPKQKVEPVEALSGIKQLMKTPKQKVEPVEALSGIKQLMKTPKQKVEPVEALSGIKQLMKTPKQKVEPVEALSAIRQLMRTPKQQSEPVEVLSGIKQLLRTPQQKPEPVEVLSDIKLLMKTPQQELEPVTDESAFKRLLKAPAQNRQAVTLTKRTPKVKYQLVEDMTGVSRIFKTPKDKAEPMEDVFDISRLVKTPKEKYQPVDDFVGLQRLMAEPRQKCSDSEVDYAGVMEMFDAPEETEVKSVKAMDSKQEDAAPFCTDSTCKREDIGNISEGEDSQQKESASAGPSTQRRGGRRRKRVPPASAEHCRRELNLKELQSVEKKSKQEEMEAKNEGRGRRTNHHIQEETVSEPPVQEKVDVSSVEPHGATQRPRRGKRKDQKELKHPSENPETCDKDAPVLQEEKQALQKCGISDMVETEDGPIIKTGSALSSTDNENCQLQTGLEETENKSNEGGAEDSEEILLSPRSRVRGVRKVASPEPLILPKRGRRGRNDQVQQAASVALHRTTRKLRKDPSEKVLQREEETFVKGTEAATAEEPENRTKLEIKIPEKRVKSLRSAGKYSTEVKADIGRMALENIQTVQKTEETSAEAGIEPIKNVIKASQGDETENAQENTTEAPQKFKAELPSGETNRKSVPANRNAVKETRTRNRRGKKDSLEKKSDEFAKDVKNLELIAPQIKSEVDESSLQDSVGSVCVKNTYQVMKDQNTPTATPEPAADSDGLAQSHPKQTRNDQGIKTTKQTETLQENEAHSHGLICPRGRGRKVKFELEEASSKAVEGSRSLPEDGKGMTDKKSLQETSENPPSQVRRSRRKQADTIPQIAFSTLMEKQTLTAEHSKDEASTKEQDSALEAAPSSTEDIPLRRGRRREVAAASQTSRSLSTRRRCGLLEGDDKKMTVREDQNRALGNETLQAKANASARDEREKIDLAAEAKSSSPLQRKCGLSETDGKGEGTCEEQNVPLETVSCAKEKPLGRGRRKQTALASHTATYIPLRGKHGLPADNGSKEAPKEDQNVPLETSDSSVKQNQLRKSRRKQTALLLEATSSASLEGKQGLAKESGRKTNLRGAKKLLLENSISQEKINPSKGNSRETITTEAVSSTSLQALPEESKSETPEEQQSVLLEVAPSAKENPSRVGRKRTTSSTSKETSSASLGEKPVLPKVRGQKRILKEDKGASLENNSSQETTRQLRNKSKRVEFKLEAATSTSHCKNGDLPENGKASETQEMCLTSAGSEGNHQSGKGEEITPAPQAAPPSRNRKRQLPADDLPAKKLKLGNDGNPAPQKGKRNKDKEEPEGNLRATQNAGGMDRKTRSSTRTSAKARK
ncbi:proliferation marker protein Ki-67 isoform X2 [Pezoporus flaviventris]|uniref:proliferation marker protein Ki-67 isoform X2 n=1 Tax=Pezoporus flaviventris TaxID=889875 RepID=UPI002AB23BD7|nr:proliferation marker protein Ki-67 isoform X2 [Pezoporus flaviventris]